MMSIIKTKKCLLAISLLIVTNAQAQIGSKVKTLFGNNEPNRTEQYLQQVQALSTDHVYSGSPAELKLANYIAQEFAALLYKPYLGKYVHQFSIDNDNNFGANSYIKIFSNKLIVGKEVVVPTFSGTGKFYAQALPGMHEPENLWFIKFSEVGEGLNNKHDNGTEKLYRKAKEAFALGAEAVMFVNDDGPASDFTPKLLDPKTALNKPVFILNHNAYEEYILQEGRGKEWINIDYDYTKTKLHLEGHNVVGYWQNQSNKNIVIAARIDELDEKGKNTAGLTALLLLAERINKARFKNYNYILVGLSGTNEGRIGATAFLKKIGLNASNTSACIHIDDVGDLTSKNELYISGTGTAASWNELLDGSHQKLIFKRIESGEVGKTNHRAFYDRQIPIINVFTKRTKASKGINKEGISMVATSMGDLLIELDKLGMMRFTKTKPLPDTKKLNLKLNMGITPDYAFDGKGLLIGHVTKNSPAAYSTVTAGDILVRMDTYDIRDVNDYVRELAKYKKGDRLMIQVIRNGVAKQMLITFK